MLEQIGVDVARSQRLVGCDPVVNSIFFASSPCLWASSIAYPRMSPNGPAGEPIFSGASAARATNGKIAAAAIRLRRFISKETLLAMIKKPSQPVATKLHQ